MGLATRQLAKKPGRSAMLTLAVAVAVALLVALQSLAAGFLDAQTSEARGSAVDVVWQPLATRGSLQDNGLSAAGLEDAHREAREVAAIPGVASASPTLDAILVARGADGNATQVLAQGVIPGDHLAALSAAQRAKFHGYFASADDPRWANGTYAGPASGEIVVNRALANRHNLSVGSTLDLAPSPTDAPHAYRVAGIFDSPQTGSGLLGGLQVALFPLSELQELTGHDATDAASRLAIRLAPATRDDAAATARVLDTLRARHAGFQVITREDQLQAARERAAVSAGFYTAVAYVSLVVSALFVASVMIMEVQQRRRDLGVLRAVGVSRASLFRSVAGEAILFVGLGTALGLVLGYFGSEWLGAYFQRGYGLDQPFTSFTPTLALASAAQSLLVGVLAALWPAWRASRVDALSILRSAR